MALLSLQMALGSSQPGGGGHARATGRNAQAGRRETDRRCSAWPSRPAASRRAPRSTACCNCLSEFPDKLVLFTQFRATQDLLQARLTQAGHKVAVFHGGLTRLAQGGGHQRIPRPGPPPARDRVRQRRPQLAVRPRRVQLRPALEPHAHRAAHRPAQPDRPDARHPGVQPGDGRARSRRPCCTCSQAKLNLFELVIGEIDMILGNLDEEREFEDVVADLWAESDDMGDFRTRMEEPGRPPAAAKAEYQEQQAHDNKIFGDRFTPDQ